MGILLAGVLLASLFAMKSVVDPIVSTFVILYGDGMTLTAFGKFAVFAIAYLAGTITVTLIAFWLAITSFISLTKNIDELAEIKKGNVAISIVLAMSIVVIGYFLGSAINGFLEGITPEIEISASNFPPPKN